MATVSGSDGADWLVGTNGADTIKGWDGNDTLKGGGGADTLNGGSGIDTAIYADSPDHVFVDLESGAGWYGSAEGDKLISIENVYGSAYDDYVWGNGGANTLAGLDGDDDLLGGGGDDHLDGGYGNDNLAGGSGFDLLDGGVGDDSASYQNSPMGVFISLISDFASGGDADGDNLNSIENLDGSEQADYLWGDDGENDLFGNGGNDSLRGFGGFDILSGGDGQDALFGMDGVDFLSGGDGDDLVDGGAGADWLKGGGGADRLVWRSAVETGTSYETADAVFDFNAAEGDRLDLSEIDADVYAAGNQAFRFIGTAAFSGTPGEINYVYENGNTVIQMQTGTSADVEGVIVLAGIVTPEASWFVL